MGSLLNFRIKRVTNYPIFHLFHQFLLKFIVNSFLNENSWKCNTYFTLKITKSYLCYKSLLFFMLQDLLWTKLYTLLWRIPNRARSTALSTSASSKTMIGDLPPNSSDTGFKLLNAAACITRRPVSVEPVKLTCKTNKT